MQEKKCNKTVGNSENRNIILSSFIIGFFSPLYETTMFSVYTLEKLKTHQEMCLRNMYVLHIMNMQVFKFLFQLRDVARLNLAEMGL